MVAVVVEVVGCDHMQSGGPEVVGWWRGGSGVVVAGWQ